MPRWLAQRTARACQHWLDVMDARLNAKHKRTLWPERCRQTRPYNVNEADGLMLVGADMRFVRVSFAGRDHAAGIQPE
jgi:hypothetical protein